MTIGAFATTCVSLPLILRRASRFVQAHSDGPLNWENFLSVIEDYASSKALNRGADQESYVHEVMRVARRLVLSDPMLKDSMAVYERDGGHVPQPAVLEERRAFEVTLLAFEAGEGIPHHDHPNMTCVQLCAAGRVTIHNFDLVSAKNGATAHTALLHSARHGVLTKGMTSSLTSNRANIHALHAETPCQLIELFTPPFDSRSMSHVRWFKLKRITPDNLFEVSVLSERPDDGNFSHWADETVNGN